MTVIGCVYCPPDVRYTHDRLLIFDGHSACEGCIETITESLRAELNKQMQGVADKFAEQNERFDKGKIWDGE